MKKLKRILLALLVMLVSVVPYNSVSAEGGQDVTERLIDSVIINPKSVNDGEDFYLDASFSNKTEQIKKGDYILINWKTEEGGSIEAYNIDEPFKLNNGAVVGRIVVNKNEVKITFDENIEKYIDVSGSFYFQLNARHNTDPKQIVEGIFQYGNKTENVKIKQIVNGERSIFGYKAGVIRTEDLTRVNWFISFNLTHEEFDTGHSILIKDTLVNAPQDHAIEYSSLDVTVKEEDSEEALVYDYAELKNNDHQSGIKIHSKSSAGFTLELNPQIASGRSYTIFYQSKILNNDALNFKNNIDTQFKLVEDKEVEMLESASVDNKFYGYDSQGARAGELIVHKYIAETKYPIADVAFNLLDANHEIIETLKTDENGKISKTQLKPNTYYIQEVSAPEWIDFEPGSGTKHEVIIEPGADKGVELTIYNEVKKRDVSGTKTWIDNNKDLRPNSIEVSLIANDAVIDSKEVKESDNWEYTFSNLPRFDENGEEITYQVKEKEVIGYESKVEGFDLVNTLITTSIDVNKEWKNDIETNRPDEITVTLLADGNLYETKKITKEDNWKITFDNLPKFNPEGDEVVYTISEVPVPGYETKIDDYTITNTFKPESISGQKTWVNDVEKFRPESITVSLYANDKKLTEKTVTAKDDWKYTFTALASFDKYGKEIKYEIKEKDVKGYESKVVGYDLVNTLKPITVSGTKTWLDNNNLFRPESITINLFADGDLFETKEVSASDNWKYTFENLPEFNQKGEKIKYTVDEVAVPGYEVIRDGMNLTNQLQPLSISGTKTWVNDNKQFRPESITVSLHANGKKLTEKKVTAKDDWKYTFTGLASFDKYGKEIKYEIKEIDVKGYESKVVGYDLVNTLKPITVSGTKTWLDNNNPFRPESITINLFADGDLFETKEVSASDNWKYTFENLPEFNQKGEKIKYTVDEVAVPGYEVIRDGMNLTNQLQPLSISGTKTWVNDNEQFRPESITVSLHANGKKLTEKKVTAKDDWKYTFSNLSQFDEKGKEIKYELKEKDVKGYESKVNKSDITNTLISTAIFGQKIWQDDENLESRPEYITVELYANDLYLTETKVTKETNWNYEFTDLHIYDQNGEEINYTIKEKAVSGYITTYDGLDIINTRNEQFDLIVNKEWVMVDSGGEKAPVTVILSSNKGYEKEVTITENDNWTYTFENLELFDEKGQEIVYTLIEKDLPGFTSEIIESDEGYTVINTANPIEPDEPEVEEVLGVSRKPREPEVEAVLAANRLPQTGMGFSNSAKLGFVLLISGIAIVLKKKED